MKTWFSMLVLVVAGCSESESSSKFSLQVEGRAVECHEGTGEGDAPGPDDKTLSCDQTYSECSDGKTYRVTCESVVGSGASTCQCYIDDEAVSAAVNLPDECPVDEEQVRAACQWD